MATANKTIGQKEEPIISPSVYISAQMQYCSESHTGVVFCSM